MPPWRRLHLPRPRQRRSGVRSLRPLRLIVGTVSPMAKITARESRRVSSNDGPRQPAEIFLLGAEAHNGRDRWVRAQVVLHGGRIPKQDNLADGGSKRIVGHNLLFDLLNDVRLVPKSLKPFEYLAQEGIKRTAVHAVQILATQFATEIVDTSQNP